MTTATIEHPRTTTELFPEFIRIPDCKRLFGIRRSTLYQILRTGKVKSVALRRDGAAKGCRLISTASLRDWLSSQIEEQKNPVATPAKKSPREKALTHGRYR
jgi:hypothetical protein